MSSLNHRSQTIITRPLKRHEASSKLQTGPQYTELTHYVRQGKIQHSASHYSTTARFEASSKIRIKATKCHVTVLEKTMKYNSGPATRIGILTDFSSSTQSASYYSSTARHEASSKLAPPSVAALFHSILRSSSHVNYL